MNQSESSFRHDPMLWVKNDNSAQGALVRTRIFNAPKTGDQELLIAAQETVLKGQKPEGYLGDAEDKVTGTGAELLKAVMVGAPLDRREVKRAIGLILKHPKGDQGFGALSPYAIEALCRLGRTSDPQLRESIQRWIDIEEQWNHPSKLCPWTPAVILRALWCARDVADVDAIVKRGLVSIRDNLDKNGRIGYNDPWGFVDCAGAIEHPIAREIIVKQMPFILSEQREDGAWADHSFATFRALQRHGFLREAVGK